MSAKQDIIALETKFWDTMISKDADTASAMMAEKSIVIGPQGVSEIKRGDFAKMMDGSKWTLDSYKLSDVQVVFPTDETAVIGYKVKQKGEMDGKPYDMECADSSTWIKADGAWLCALHTETVLGEPA
jgi:ketosteroid isomerase-like protein